MNTLKSRKFITACISAAVVIAGRLGFDLDVPTLMIIATPFTLAIGGWTFESVAESKVAAALDGPVKAEA